MLAPNNGISNGNGHNKVVLNNNNINRPSSARNNAQPDVKKYLKL